MLTMCGCDASQVGVDAVVDVDVETAAVVVVIVSVVVLVLHWTPYHFVSLLPEQGLVMVIQLVVSFQVVAPLVDKYNTFKLYFSLK